ncbi:MAG TPA: hypothetical protein VLJ84_12100, partial [Usitatibacter sp.]|nr:hypothetical protein [Usitatibacter sp.]
MPASTARLTWTAALPVCASLLIPAYAQTSGTTPSTSTAASPKAESRETIVVTATKRKEDVTKIPL